MVKAMMVRINDWGPNFHGSTRPIALIRIGLALIVWLRYGRDMALHSTTTEWEALLSICFFLFSTLMLIGLYTRIAIFGVSVLLAYFYFEMGAGERPHYVAHHTYLLMSAIFLLIFTPSNKSYSFDRFRLVQKCEANGAPPPDERGPLWAQRLIVLQMAALYFWTAVDKTGLHFLSGARLEAIFTWAHTGKPLESIISLPILLFLIALAVVIIEYFLAFGIIVQRWHGVAVPIGITLHALFFIILPLSTFSITMILLYLAVINPDKLHQLIDRLQGHATTSRHL